MLTFLITEISRALLGYCFVDVVHFDVDAVVVYYSFVDLLHHINDFTSHSVFVSELVSVGECHVSVSVCV